MYRVLIVDDEPFIVNNIFQLLAEESQLELETYRAYNVYEALDCLAHNRIDIVISDIRMPGMSGIELHERIIHSWPMCKVIFLTGFNEFDYARKAIRMGGVVDYVLKNEDDHVLLAAVEKAFVELGKLEQQVNQDIQARTKLHLAMPAFQKSTLLELISEPVAPVKERARKLAESDIPILPDKPVFLVVGSMDGWDEGMNEAGRMLLLYACQNIASEYLKPTCIQLSFTLEAYKLVWFIQPGGLLDGETRDAQQEQRAWQHLKTRVYSIMETVQQTCMKLLKHPVSFVIAREPYGWEQIGTRMKLLSDLLDQYTGNGQEMLIQDSDKPSSSYELADGEYTERLIPFIHHYVTTHLDGDLSLTTLATLVHHSPTYLSRLYRRTTGTMLSDYITNERMKKAKELLSETGMKIQEIAITAGYEAASQFNRSFKRIFQITPQEYRERSVIERELKRATNAKKDKDRR
ncbi:response regulator transcription factor [Paenibacillus eucommiae]|uniref:Two-component system response regulator YesN n=1 Tax=Paenibacillus eucommiae TaxID=1355755 RepID=A0ABS4J4A8_9BACL|nr:response regulator [Paenibacillus eucommiae]MBP1994120.1 two-component system response regulator YesN [Paenibacillus eucommiae]